MPKCSPCEPDRGGIGRHSVITPHAKRKCHALARRPTIHSILVSSLAGMLCSAGTMTSPMAARFHYFPNIRTVLLSPPLKAMGTGPPALAWGRHALFLETTLSIGRYFWIRISACFVCNASKLALSFTVSSVLPFTPPTSLPPFDRLRRFVCFACRSPHPPPDPH